MTYKKLNIDRKKITPLLKQYCENEIENASIDSKTVRKGQEEQFIIKGNLGKVKKEIKISFISNQEGSTTINYKMGKSQDISQKMADFICDNGIIDSRNYTTYSLNGVSLEDFELVINSLETDFKSIETSNKNIQHGIQKKLKIESGEAITFNYYNNGSLTITGRPLLFHSSALNYFTELEYIKPSQRFESAVQYYQINTKFSEFEIELKRRLPISFQHLPENIKALILSGVILEKIEVNLPDYSTFTFNVLKAIEGLMKHLLFEKGVIIERSFDIFKKDIEPVEIKKSISTSINCTNTNKVIENLYEFYKKERHTLFHTEYIDVATRIIDKREDAVEILNESLLLIDDSYNIILNG